jgi:heme oxygenase (biliverdin-IX-beta and delta-forming)
MYKDCRDFTVNESLRERLRRETAPAHSRLETFIETRDFFASVTRYTAFLQASQAFQSEAEKALDECDAAAVIPDWPRRQRARLARNDLQALGQTCTDASTFTLTKVATPEWVLGVAYVLEGATLGGGVLLKTVARLNVSAEHGASFLASYGSQRGAMWQAFLTTLAHWENRGITQQKVISAAAEAFDGARRHFEALT